MIKITSSGVLWPKLMLREDFFPPVRIDFLMLEKKIEEILSSARGPSERREWDLIGNYVGQSAIEVELGPWATDRQCEVDLH